MERHYSQGLANSKDISKKVVGWLLVVGWERRAIKVVVFDDEGGISVVHFLLMNFFFQHDFLEDELLWSLPSEDLAPEVSVG